MFYLIVCASVLEVIGLTLFQNRIYRFSVKQLVVFVAVIVIIGGAGIYALAFLEEGIWGMSFFGSVFATSIAMVPTAKLLKIPLGDVMDVCGPICAGFLALSKVNCWYHDCCLGITIGMAKDGDYIRFPSQIVEGLNGLILCGLLLVMQRNPQNKGRIAPIFLLYFGTTRFALNSFREGLETFWLFEGTGLFIPKGHFWSVVCIIWGLIWMYRIVSKNKGQKASFKEVATAILDMFRFRSREEIS